MTSRQVSMALLAPVSLVVLVVALGALQYQWVGQVSEAERSQLAQSLDRRAREFADDFDRELGRLHQMLRPAAGFSVAAPSRFARQYDDWRASARVPDLVRAAYVAAPGRAGTPLYRYDPESRVFARVDWPASLEPARDRLRAEPPMPLPSVTNAASPAASVLIAVMPVLPDVPALVIAEAQPPSGEARLAARDPGDAAATGSFAPRHYAIIELDRAAIAGTLLPALADTHFPDSLVDGVHLVVIDGQATVVYRRGLSGDRSIDPATADASAALFGLRVETIRGIVSPSASSAPGSANRSTFVWSAPTTSPPPAALRSIAVPAEASAVTPAGSGPDPIGRLTMVVEQHTASVSRRAGGQPTTGWTLLVQHSAGSLDAAIERVRHGNLWLSFSILGVLAASAGLVMVNARRSERLAAQQMDFVATVSHELRTPLAVIRSAAQNLAAGVVQQTDQAKRYGALIETEGRRLTDMVEQVLEYAGASGHRRATAARPVDVADIARDVVSASESLPDAVGVRFEVRVDDPAPLVVADEGAIRRALLNLVGNAVKHGREGGWVGVTIARGAGADAGHIVVAVADRGRGIPADDLAQVFEPFYRGAFARDRQIQGSGLGLSLVARIAEAHGGRVTASSTPGQGATFTLSLPAATAPSARAAASCVDRAAVGGAAESAGRHPA